MNVYQDNYDYLKNKYLSQQSSNLGRSLSNSIQEWIMEETRLLKTTNFSERIYCVLSQPDIFGIQKKKMLRIFYVS